MKVARASHGCPLSDDLVRMIHQQCKVVHNGVMISSASLGGKHAIKIRVIIDNLRVRRSVVHRVVAILDDLMDYSVKHLVVGDHRWELVTKLRDGVHLDVTEVMTRVHRSMDVCNVAYNTKTCMMSFGVRDSAALLSAVCVQFRDALRECEFATITPSRRAACVAARERLALRPPCARSHTSDAPAPSPC